MGLWRRYQELIKTLIHKIEVNESELSQNTYTKAIQPIRTYLKLKLDPKDPTKAPSTEFLQKTIQKFSMVEISEAEKILQEINKKVPSIGIPGQLKPDQFLPKDSQTFQIELNTYFTVLTQERTERKRREYENSLNKVKEYINKIEEVNKSEDKALLKSLLLTLIPEAKTFIEELLLRLNNDVTPPQQLISEVQTAKDRILEIEANLKLKNDSDTTGKLKEMMDSADGLCDPAGANHLGEGIKKYKELIAYVESQNKWNPNTKKQFLRKLKESLNSQNKRNPPSQTSPENTSAFSTTEEKNEINKISNKLMKNWLRSSITVGLNIGERDKKKRKKLLSKPFTILKLFLTMERFLSMINQLPDEPLTSIVLALKTIFPSTVQNMKGSPP
jgi:hypothetical protein